MRTGLFLAILFTLLKPAGEPIGDRRDLQGTWRIVLLMDSGETVPTAAESRVVITAERLTLRDKKYPLDVSYRLDASKGPKWFDLVVPQTQYKGIYELKGDTLRICFNERPRGERPSEFGSLRDSPSDVLLVLQREKK